MVSEDKAEHLGAERGVTALCDITKVSDFQNLCETGVVSRINKQGRAGSVILIVTEVDSNP